MRIADLPKYELQPEEMKEVDSIISNYKGKKGVLIPLLLEIQKKVGFLPIAAFDSHDGRVYVGITINKEKMIDDLRDSIRRALGFAVKVMYTNEQTVKYFLAKASMEEKALTALYEKTQTTTKEDV